MDPPKSRKQPIVLGIAAFPVTVAALDVFVSAVALRPLPILSVGAALALAALSVCVIFSALGRVTDLRLLSRMGCTLCAVLLAHFAKLSLPANVPAAIRPDLREMGRFKPLTYPEVQESEVRTEHDFWGGCYHIKRQTDGPLLVWSDGPDADDDNAERPIGKELFSFERGFQGWYWRGYLPWQRLLKRVAYWETMAIWGHLDGDIVWEVRDGGIYLK